MFFAGLALILVTFSPLDLRGMGYSGEELDAAERAFAWLSGAPDAPSSSQLLSGRGVLSRHGIVETLVKLPLVTIGHLLERLGARSEDLPARVASLTPLLETAAIVSLLWVWSAHLLGDSRRAWGFALGAAFCTLYWPYAYIGLEPTQGALLLLAAYLALGPPPARTTAPRTALFGVALAVAAATKNTGALLLPALAFLILHNHRRRAAESSTGGRLPATISLALGVFAAMLASKLLRGAFQPSWIEADTIHQFLETNPVRIAASVSMLLFSANKGLLFYAPLAFLGLCAALSKDLRRSPVAAFALLLLLPILGGFATVGIPAEETWGPRYLYVTLGPLLLCWASAPLWPARRAVRRALTAAALTVGFGVAALGSLFFYGRTFQAAQTTGQATLKALASDPVWNPIVMHLRLVRLRLAPEGTRTDWTPTHHWWFERPAGMPPDRSVDLAFALDPQPLLLRARTPWTGKAALSLCFVAGALLLAASVRGLRAKGVATARFAE